MSEELEAEFQQADIILSEALSGFQEAGVSQYVYGMALLEIGVAALVKLEETDEAILSVSQDFIDKAKSFQATAFPVPRDQ